MPRPGRTPAAAPRARAAEPRTRAEGVGACGGGSYDRDRTRGNLRSRVMFQAPTGLAVGLAHCATWRDGQDSPRGPLGSPALPHACGRFGGGDPISPTELRRTVGIAHRGVARSHAWLDPPPSVAIAGCKPA